MPDFVIDISVLLVVKIGTYISVSSAALLVYDYFLTLPNEIQYVWRANWCLGKALYLVSKYFMLIVFMVELHWITSRDVSEAECRTLNTILHYTYLLAVIAAENILTLRVWALWHQRLWVTIMLGCLCVVGIVLGFKDISTGYRNDTYLTDYAMASLSYPGCAAVGDDRTASATSYITVLVHETIVFLLMAINGIHVYSTMPVSSIMYTFYEDGLMYYAALLAMSIVNMIVSLTQPTEYINLFLPTQVALHSALSTRLYLNLRQSLGEEVCDTCRIGLRTFEGGTSRGPTSGLRFAAGREGSDDDDASIV